MQKPSGTITQGNEPNALHPPHFWVIIKLLMQLLDLVFQLIFVFLQSFWKIC